MVCRPPQQLPRPPGRSQRQLSGRAEALPRHRMDRRPDRLGRQLQPRCNRRRSRAYNWAEEMGYLAGTPLKKIKKPPAKRRELYTTPEDYLAILALLPEN